MDVATAIVVVGLVGEYRKHFVRFSKSLRSKDWKAAGRIFLLLVFPLMVVCGVAGELWVNLRVSQLENAWETAQLPRDLSPKDQEEIANKIKQYAGTPFDLSMHVEVEPMRLLDKIEDALLAAGWKEQPVSDGGQTFNRMNRPAVGERTVAGVWVMYPVQSGPPFDKAAEALVDALRDKKIGTALIRVDPGDKSDLGVIHIWVGGKP